MEDVGILYGHCQLCIFCGHLAYFVSVSFVYFPVLVNLFYCFGIFILLFWYIYFTVLVYLFSCFGMLYTKNLATLVASSPSVSEETKLRVVRLNPARVYIGF
jgi:hypothetical protein